MVADDPAVSERRALPYPGPCVAFLRTLRSADHLSPAIWCFPLEFDSFEFRRPHYSAPELIHERQNLLAGLEHFSNPFVD